MSEIEEPIYDEVAPEEVVMPEDYQAVKPTRGMVLTFGMEIEQPSYLISSELRRRYTWYQDPSGPLETALPPSRVPNQMLKKFIDTVNETHSQWTWVNEYGTLRKGCGSHIHFRPRDDLYANTPNWAEAWATAHNTFVDIIPFLLPLLCWGSLDIPKHFIRQSAERWAQPQLERYKPETVERRFLDPSYQGHPYHSVAMDRKTEEHILTIEIRLAEVHPAVASYFGNIMERLINKCYERGFKSPKLRDDPEGRYRREDVLRTIYQALYYHSQYVEHQDMSDRVGDFIEQELRSRDMTEFYFDPPIPAPKPAWRPITRIKGYYNTFNNIIYYFTSWSSLWQLRLYHFYRQKGIPVKNNMAFWNIYAPKGQFRWIEPHLRSPPDGT
jgi:hypothetical protein